MLLIVLMGCDELDSVTTSDTEVPQTPPGWDPASRVDAVSAGRCDMEAGSRSTFDTKFPFAMTGTVTDNEVTIDLVNFNVACYEPQEAFWRVDGPELEVVVQRVGFGGPVPDCDCVDSFRIAVPIDEAPGTVQMFRRTSPTAINELGLVAL